jgi:Flp pilus assembly protein TadB
VQAHGLSEPSAAFSAALTQQVVARYARPHAAPFRAGAWLGTVILLLLACLLVVATCMVLATVSTVLVTSSVAVVGGTGGLIWLLEHYRKSLLQQQSAC